MTWLLTIILILDGQPVAQPVGLMIDALSCHLAGASMAQALAMANPGTRVIWRCDPPQEGLS